MQPLGFDFDARPARRISRIPSAAARADDVRITTRYDEDDFARALMGVLHETGHALYERRPAARLAPPAGRQCARHGAAREPVAADGDAGLPLATPSSRSPRRACARPSASDGPAWTADNLHRLYTRVAPGFIRVDADEVTYPAAHHAALPARARDDRAATWRSPTCPAPGTTACRSCWASCRPTIASAACRTSIGRTAPGAISRPTRWARWPRPSSSPPPRRAVPGLLSRDRQGRFRAAARPGCAPTCTARARSASTDRSWSQATGAPLGTAAFKAHLETRYLSA